MFNAIWLLWDLRQCSLCYRVVHTLNIRVGSEICVLTFDMMKFLFLLKLSCLLWLMARGTMLLRFSFLSL